MPLCRSAVSPNFAIQSVSSLVPNVCTGVQQLLGRGGWEGRLLYLRELAGQPPPPAESLSGVRVVVQDVETYWAMAQEIQAPIVEPLSDDDGVRAFTIADPDGFGLQFATPIGAARPQERTCGCGTRGFVLTEHRDNKVTA